jgi:uncharacterized protein YhaN
MRLHRIRLRNFRGVTDSTVAFPTEGVTIVEGANEVGKTCIPEALDLVLRALDSSKTKQVRAIKPVHRDEAPEVEIELSLGDYQFVYSKRWLRQPQTTLEITSPRHEQLTGREAHDRVEGILDESLDADLWRALRIEQGTELALPLFNVPSLGRALDLAAGGDLTSGREDDLWDRICNERDRYWTATGQVKSERTSLENGAEEARGLVADFERQLQEIESDAVEVERLVADSVRLVATRDECDGDERELNERWALTEQHRSDVETLGVTHGALLAQRDRIAGDSQHRQDLVDAVAARADELSALEVEAAQAAPALAAAIGHDDEAATALNSARTALRNADVELRQANDDREHHRQLIEVSQLTERYERVIVAQDVLSTAETHLESVRVDDELVTQIEQAHLAVVRAEAAAGSGAALVETIALSDITVRIDGDDVALHARASNSVVVTDEVVLVVPDVVEVRVRAGTGSRNLAAGLNSAREELDHQCKAGGVADLAEARQAAEDRRSAQRNRDEAQKTIEQDLRDLTVDLLSKKIERLSERTESYAAGRPADLPLPPSFEDAKQIASDAERLVAELQDERVNCEIAADSATNARTAAELAEASLGGKMVITASAKKDAEGLLAAAREEHTDADLSEALAAARNEADTARGALDQAESALHADDPDSLEALLANARDATKRAVGDLQSNKGRHQELRIKLELRGEEGLHSRHSDAMSQLQHLERERERTESRAGAALLLHERFAARRQEARQRYVAPFKQRIEQFGRIVFGPTFQIDLDDDLRVARRTLGGITLDVDQLSIGAREQLGVLSRLACAVIVSPDGGGAPVVFDDALGWSDPSRLERMGAAIAVAGKECQIIVLTCTPGRYAHVGNATVISLPS